MALTDDMMQDNIIDLDIQGIQRTKFRINGDSNAIIELNLSDLGIIKRLEEGIAKLEAQMEEIAAYPSDDEHLSDKLKKADDNMREYVDYIFDYPVSAACAKYGTMYDPKDGKFRYEIIIDALTKLYNDNLNEEYKKFQDRIKKHTAKYAVSTTTKGKKTKGK